MSTTRGERAPRLYGPVFCGTAANHLLQSDYIKVAQSATDDKYVFMLHDYHSNYKFLLALPNTSAKNAA